MLQKQAIYTILVSLTVLLTACDSSKQSETDTDAKSSVFKTEQAEVLPYLNRRTCKIIVPADTAVAPLKKEAFF